MSHREDPVVVTVGDKLDIYSVETLRSALREALNGSAALQVDLGEASQVHTAALQVLIAAARACREGARPFSLVGVSPRVAATLRMARLDDALYVPAEGLG